MSRGWEDFDFSNDFIDWEKIFSKEYLKLNDKKTNNLIKNGPKTLTDTSPK